MRKNIVLAFASLMVAVLVMRGLTFQLEENNLDSKSYQFSVDELHKKILELRKDEHTLRFKETRNNSTSLERSRNKRQAILVWPRNSLFVSEFYFTIPLASPAGVVIPFTIDVPYRFFIPNVTTEFLGATGRSIRDERFDLYGTVENLFDRFGFDGHACVLRAICERGESHFFTDGLLGEFLGILLAASSGTGGTEMYEYLQAEYQGRSQGGCGATYSGCPMSIFKWLDGR